jgi:uncharacterized protein (TIGR04255 family)
VIELGFLTDFEPDELAKALHSKLSQRYAGEPFKRARVEFGATIGPEEVSASTRRVPHLSFLRSADGLRLLGCRARALSVHVLSPYPGWENFREQLEEALGALPDEIRDSGLARMGVRYIDHIVLPREATSFVDYVKVFPSCPDALPRVVSSFQFVTQTVDPDDATIARMVLARGPEEGPSIVFDLHLQRQGEPLAAVDDGSWRSILEALHERQREVFEGAITDKARELFS